MSEDDFETILLIGAILGALLSFTMQTIYNVGNDYSTIDVKSLGEKICDEHNLNLANFEVNNRIPKFYCTNETKIEDAYLVLIG